MVINKSTVPVGSAGIVGEVIGRGDVAVVSNPEFLREGTAVNDFLKPDRVVIGCDDRSAAVRLADLYSDLGAPVLVTDAASAEMIKYASNAFLATKISFVNAVAAVCEAVGADVNDVTLGMGYDKRIGSQFLRPGPGWGGSCFPKDSHALINIAEQFGYDFELLKGVVAVNEDQFARVADKVATLAGGSVDGKTIAVWGLTFKALTDDLRDSPALRIIELLVERGARVQAFDPAISEAPTADIDARRRCLRRLRGRRGGRIAHRVGRVPLARLRQGRTTSSPRVPWSTPATSSTGRRCDARASP